MNFSPNPTFSEIVLSLVEGWLFVLGSIVVVVGVGGCLRV